MTATNELMALPVHARAALAMESSQTESKLHELAIAYSDIIEVKDKAGREQVHSAAMVLKNTRLAIEKTGKAAREDATAYSKAVIMEEGRLKAIIGPEELRLFGLRDGWDEEQARIKREEEERERQRVAAIRARIEELRKIPLSANGKDSVEIAVILADTLATIPTDAEYAELKVEAGGVLLESVQTLQKMLFDQQEKERVEAERAIEAERQREAQEEESKRLAAERAELERVRAELTEQRRKADAYNAELARQSEELEAQRKAQEEAAKPQTIEPSPASEPVVDSRPVITVELEPTPEFPILENVTPPTLRLGQMTDRLGFTVTADFLLSLGFAHSGTDKAAKLFHESEFKLICAAIQRHVSAVTAKFD